MPAPGSVTSPASAPPPFFRGAGLAAFRLERLGWGTRLLLGTLSIPLVLALGVLLGMAAGQVAAEPPSYAELRSLIVSAHLRQIDEDYILLAGDSHVELSVLARLCGLRVVNAGLSGATAADYAAFFSGLAVQRRPRAAVVTLGTNDAQRRRKLAPETAARRYADGMGRLLPRMRAVTPLVLVTAPPPVDGRGAQEISPEALDRIAAATSALCTEPDCRYAAPYADTQSFLDGVHLRDYAESYRRLEARLCPALGMGGPAVARR